MRSGALAGVCAIAVSAGTIASRNGKRQRRACAAQERAPGQRDLANDHHGFLWRVHRLI